MNFNALLKKTISAKFIENDLCGNLIREALFSCKPSMIGRFGSTEIKAILYPELPFFISPFIKNRVLQNMATLSGFFPSNSKTIKAFSELMYQDMRELDILGSWRIEEFLLRKHFPTAKLVELKCLEPYFSENPWTEILEGKKVLVVHPFSTTIERQYHENREHLFLDKRVLPKFQSLETVKAVQTIAGTKGDFGNWFEALDSMKAAIDKKDYDVAILGCGAYGFPLAAHVKRRGKKAVHLGGATQILFGIRGKRWDTHPVISGFYNDYWVRPAPEDVPSGAAKVENGCYW